MIVEVVKGSRAVRCSVSTP